MTTPYAAAWLSEMWPTVREYHDTPDVPIPSPMPVRVREKCPLCGRRYAPTRIADHVVSAHPESVLEAS